MLVKTFQVGIDWQYHRPKASNWNRIVRPYYSDFKTEIMEYRYINNIMEEYQSRIHKKAVEYHATNLVKSIKDEIGYIIPFSYLICIILYTDYSELSTDFSSTFRAKHKYEPLGSIRKRNERYYWLSKGLTEMISDYGQSYDREVGLLSKLCGPFYTGMSFVMNVNDFKMKLAGPTSSSVHKEVAIRFGGQNGMLLEFDNSYGSGRKVHGFDFSWISRYGLQEDERYNYFIYSSNTQCIVCK